MNKIVPSGLALYAVSSSLGLFLGPDPYGMVMMVWLTGFVFLAFTVCYSSLISRDSFNSFPLIVLGVILLNFLMQVTGGANSLLWPVYFLFTALIAGFSHYPVSRTWTALALVLALETGNLFAPKHLQEYRGEVYAVRAVSLAGVSLTIAYIMRRIRKKEKQVLQAHERLLAHARAVDPLADKTRLPGLTREERQAANVDAALKREMTFNGLLEFIYELVPAHTYALFLKEPRGGKEVLTLRAILSESPATAEVGSTPDLDPERDQWIVGACAKTGKPKCLDNTTIPVTALGYYRMEAPVKSFFAFPIADAGGRVLGVLAVDSLEQGAFAQDTQQILERFTPFFIQIIERIQIAQELNIRASHFQSLHRIGSILNSSLELDAILGSLAEQLRSMVPHDLCLFLHYDEANDRAVVLHKSGQALESDSRAQNFMNRYRAMLHARKTSSGQDQDFPVQSNAIFFQMLKQRKSGRIRPYYFNDCGGEMRLTGTDSTDRMELRSLSCWPLVAGDKFIGAFFLGSLRPDAFSELQRNFLATIVIQIAMVVDNSIMHRRIAQMARTDGLTGLLNHRTFMENLSAEYKRISREKRPFSILLMDIDRFKSVNDTYGHPVGDLAIKAVADMLKETARATDFVARYGGEEFAVGMVDTDIKGAKKMAERLRSAMEKKVVTRVGPNNLMITLSIGVSSFPEDTRDMTQLVAMADNALYQAKKNGRNRVCLQRDISSIEAHSRHA